MIVIDIHVWLVICTHYSFIHLIFNFYSISCNIFSCCLFVIFLFALVFFFSRHNIFSCRLFVIFLFVLFFSTVIRFRYVGNSYISGYLSVWIVKKSEQFLDKELHNITLRLPIAEFPG